MMLIKPKIKITTIKADKIFSSYQLLNVRSFCQECNCYHHNYSCPPSAPTAEEYIDKNKQIILLMTLIDSQPFNRLIADFNPLDYHSDTLDGYQQIGKDLSPYTAISMYVFDTIKSQIYNKLLALEAKYDFLTLPPGKCSLCKKCQKIKGEACLHPDQLRYSLESLGFLVSDLMQEHFDYQIDWSADGFSRHFTTISGLILNRPLATADLRAELDDIELKI